MNVNYSTTADRILKDLKPQFCRIFPSIPFFRPHDLKNPILSACHAPAPPLGKAAEKHKCTLDAGKTERRAYTPKKENKRRFSKAAAVMNVSGGKKLRIACFTAAVLLLIAAAETILCFKGVRLPDPQNCESANLESVQCGWLPKPGLSWCREDPGHARTTVTACSRRLSFPEENAEPPHSLTILDKSSASPAGPILDPNCNTFNIVKPGSTLELPASADTDQLPLGIFLGCSYTFGMGVSDEETFVRLLNDSQAGNMRFINCAAIGYGTYECFKRLELAFSEGYRPAAVIYVFINDHLMRGAAPRVFGKAAETFDFTVTPWFSVDGRGELAFHPSRSLALPGERYLRVINLLSRRRALKLMEETKRQRFEPKDARIIYAAEAAAMARLCRQNGARFIVVSLDTGKNWLADESVPGKYRRNLKDTEFVNANLEELYLPEYHVRGQLNFHPSAKAHKYWAQKISAYLDERPAQKTGGKH